MCFCPQSARSSALPTACQIQLANTLIILHGIGTFNPCVAPYTSGLCAEPPHPLLAARPAHPTSGMREGDVIEANWCHGGEQEGGKHAASKQRSCSFRATLGERKQDVFYDALRTDSSLEIFLPTFSPNILKSNQKEKRKKS